MNLTTEPYNAQQARWPQSGRHILAQSDDESVVVYQAYRPAIGHFAARHGKRLSHKGNNRGATGVVSA